MHIDINTLYIYIYTHTHTHTHTHGGSVGEDSWVGEIPWRRDRLLTQVFLGFPCDSAGKESTCSVGDLGLIPGLVRSPGEGNGNPLQYAGLENSMEGIVHGVAKGQIQLGDFHFHIYIYRYIFEIYIAFLVAQMGKNLPIIQET